MNISVSNKTIVDILDAIIGWSDEPLYYGKDSISIICGNDTKFIDAVNMNIQTLMTIHQDIQAEYMNTIKGLLSDIAHKQINLSLFDNLNADEFSMLLSYYVDGENYDLIGRRFNAPVNICVSKICRGEKALLKYIWEQQK